MEWYAQQTWYTYTPGNRPSYLLERAEELGSILFGIVSALAVEHDTKPAIMSEHWERWPITGLRGLCRTWIFQYRGRYFDLPRDPGHSPHFPRAFRKAPDSEIVRLCFEWAVFGDRLLRCKCLRISVPLLTRHVVPVDSLYESNRLQDLMHVLSTFVRTKDTLPPWYPANGPHEANTVEVLHAISADLWRLREEAQTQNVCSRANTDA
ncbi:hypothetical protein QBC46DRAFT_404932 [Diplogelasinospora grovesii]|uniref:Uncharacterized protein n=1 Tax=Diplogelasinospora grovesii TaxID=303347 RepID=A0AAN6NF89_9PEZI|nr:hypothetical protein QBC46DRAFT_404932 [Diplogelasinospora grovesii]